MKPVERQITPESLKKFPNGLWGRSGASWMRRERKNLNDHFETSSTVSGPNPSSGPGNLRCRFLSNLGLIGHDSGLGF